MLANNNNIILHDTHHLPKEMLSNENLDTHTKITG